MWYYEQAGNQHGPIADDEMSALMQAGTVRPETLVWHEGQAGWQPAIDVVPQQLRPDATGAPPPLPSAEPTDMRGDAEPQWAPEDTSYDQAGEHLPATHHPRGFSASVRHVFSNYVNFKGRAQRGEYWWFVLFVLLCAFATSAVDSALFGTPADETGPIYGLFILAILLPGVGVTARRLHDIGKSGWWQLINFVPLIGFLVMIYFTVQKGDPGPNQYGPA